MAQPPQTSFIPKQSLGVAKTRERRTFNVFTFIAMVVFLSVVTLSIGVFFYRKYVETHLELKKHELAKFKEDFGATAEENIREIRLLEDRFALAEALLDQHIAVTKIFEAIEDRTQTNAVWGTFEYSRLPSGDAQLALDGKARSFNTVALQEQEFHRESSFEEGSIEFSKIDTAAAEDGGDAAVTFAVSANIDTARVAFEGVKATTTSSAATTTSSTMATTTTATTTP